MVKQSNHDVSVTLPSDRHIAFTRFFASPPPVLFQAWTEPQQLRQWWGCDSSQLVVCEVDLRPGGKWQFVMRMSDGSEHRFKGVYREILPNERLIYSECYDMPAIGSPEWLTTVNFDSVEGGTRLTHLILHPSKEARDGHLQSGMEAGIAQSFNRFESQVAATAQSVITQYPRTF